MNQEMKALDLKIKALRDVMEWYQIFQQDDEVGSALAEVEAELEKFKFK
jgi:hypothetical protein